MKILSLMVLLTLISVLYHVSTVFAAAGVTSNKVITTVGNPTGPVPGSSNTPIGSTSPTNSGPLGATVTCPLFKNGQGSVNITCGTKKNTVNSCGHGGLGYPQPCNPAIYACGPGGSYRDQLNAAVDVRSAGSNGGNMPIFLPFIDGNQSATWTKVDGPIAINGGAWGQKVEYSTNFNGKTIRIDLTHLSSGIFPISGESGQQIGTTKPGVDGGSSGHLHTAASINDVWGDSIDQTFICSNRTP